MANPRHYIYEIVGRLRRRGWSCWPPSPATLSMKSGGQMQIQLLRHWKIAFQQGSDTFHEPFLILHLRISAEQHHCQSLLKR